MADFDMDKDYNEVADRIITFYKAYPEGSLQTEYAFHVLDVPRDIKVANTKGVTKAERQEKQTIVVVTARAYRTPDDPLPAVGIASEPIPGGTPYTRDSEIMNAETSAWGRAIVATGCTRAKNIASANEIRNRRVEKDEPAAKSRVAKTAKTRPQPAAERPVDPATGEIAEPDQSTNLLGETDCLPGWTDRIHQDDSHGAVVKKLRALPRELKDEHKKWTGAKGHQAPLPLEDFKVWEAYVDGLVQIAALDGKAA